MIEVEVERGTRENQIIFIISKAYFIGYADSVIIRFTQLLLLFGFFFGFNMA